jgi:hypothetical protein
METVPFNSSENPNLILTKKQKDWILSLVNAVEDIYSYNDDNYYINYNYDLLDRNA